VPDEALIARIREDIANAKENGYDLFSDACEWDTRAARLRPRTDEEIAEDIIQSTGEYEAEFHDGSLVAAVAAVRAETANG